MKITYKKICRDIVKSIDFYGNPAMTCTYRDNDLEIYVNNKEITYSILNFWVDDDVELQRYIGIHLIESDFENTVILKWCVKKTDRVIREIIKEFTNVINYVSGLRYKSYF